MSHRINKPISMKAFAELKGVKLADVKDAIAKGIIASACYTTGNGQKSKRKWLYSDDASQLWDDYFNGVLKTPLIENKIESHENGRGHRPGSMMVKGEQESSLYSKSRAAKEAMTAKITEIKFKKLAGELCDVELVKKAAAEIAINTRDALLALPNKLAPILASETDVDAVHLLLENEIHAALENLYSRKFEFINQGFDEDDLDDPTGQ